MKERKYMTENKTYRLGDLIELCDERNTEGKYTVDDVRGMTIQKELISTKANVSETDLSDFLVVHPKEFVYNPRTHGKRIGMGFNDTNNNFIISWNNIAFRVKETMRFEVVPDYLFINFRRDEWDREACYQSWGTSTEVFSWNALCDMQITLPPLAAQQKAAAVYNALKANLAAYEQGLDDLKLVCDGFIEELRKTNTSERIGPYIEEVCRKNSNNKIKEVRSISVRKEFNLTNAKVNKEELGNYLIVEPSHLAFVQTTGNEKCLAFAYNDYDYPVVVSSVDKVIKSKDSTKLNLEFLVLFLHRAEFDRYARYHSWGSAREVFTYEDMCDVQIPLPSLEVQQNIVNMYKCYTERRRIAAELKTKIKTICPILIKGSLENM